MWPRVVPAVCQQVLLLSQKCKRPVRPLCRRAARSRPIAVSAADPRLSRSLTETASPLAMRITCFAEHVWQSVSPMSARTSCGTRAPLEVSRTRNAKPNWGAVRDEQHDYGAFRAELRPPRPRSHGGGEGAVFDVCTAPCGVKLWRKFYPSFKTLGFVGRSGRIRTCDPLVPNEVRYQTAPHSDPRRRYMLNRRATSLVDQARLIFKSCAPSQSVLVPSA